MRQALLKCINITCGQFRRVLYNVHETGLFFIFQEIVSLEHSSATAIMIVETTVMKVYQTAVPAHVVSWNSNATIRHDVFLELTSVMVIMTAVMHRMSTLVRDALSRHVMRMNSGTI